MSKWSWQARFRHIEEAVHMMNELEDMPSWDDLTLEEALEIARDVAELNDEVNGDWDFCPYDKQQYMKAKRFIEDFSSGR